MKKTLKKFALCIGLISLMQINVGAQNEIDALRFSELDWQGTARFMGAGRAFGAVGAEFSALNTNPASIGLYKRNEVTFTPMTLSIFKNASDYNGTNTLAQGVKYNVGSAGMVWALPGVSSTLWKKFQIGFGFNRVKNYNNVFSIEGRNAGSTIGSEVAITATNLGLNSDDVRRWPEGPGGAEAWIGWNSFLIDNITPTTYRPTMEGVNMFQSSTVIRTGGNDEMIFSFGSNYDDMVFIGATLGVPFIDFTENRTYKEVNDKNAESFNFQNISITDRLSVRATGINLKLGAIYQPFDFLRVGVAFHTPTYYGNVREFFERRMEAHAWEDVLVSGSWVRDYYGVEDSYANRFNYSLTTPLRAMANVAFFIQQRAFISAEYEITDYSMATMYSTRYNFNTENKNIQNLYGLSHIARIGAEFSVTQVFSIRAGYNYISSPYKDNINDGSKHYASAGLGFRTRVFYSDFAYALTTSKEKYWLYEPAFVNAVNNKFITHRVMLTMGVRF
ncbi:MAG: hypothetical protein FWC34_09720 [Bacteroidetes bacterium]|nr:hypothetical protein [Bacteroidota bacterium]MCL2301852.1 hypothetical protein [Lentimicrobiaceae bacterium]